MSKLSDYLTEETTFTPAVVGYLVKEDKVLLGLRKKVSLGLGLNLIAGIGGKVGDDVQYANETNDEALIREFNEEICVKPLEYKVTGRVRFIWVGRPQRNQDVTIYKITKWEGEPQETEAIKPSWFDIQSLPGEQMWKDNLIWVPQVLNDINVDAVFVYGEDEQLIDVTI
jgi:8-oxo-dGTP diphosphatase